MIPDVQQVQFRAMDTDIDLRLCPAPGNERAAAAALRRAEAYVHEAARRLTRFDPGSELSAINRGGPVQVSKLTFNVVRVALEAAQATVGLFDPTMLPALLAAGYDRTFDALPDARNRPRAGGVPTMGGHAGVRLNARQRTVTLPDGVVLDLGGIAKGWLADAVARRLGRYGAALADLGGDIAVTGAQRDSLAWEVEIADPFGGDVPLAVLCMQSGGVATSGVLKRRWPMADGWQHHLIDPRTGRPVESDLAAATVIAPTATAAEVAAKVALLLGSTAGAAALEAGPGLAGLLVRHDGTVVTTSGFSHWEADDGLDEKGGRHGTPTPYVA